MMHRQSIFLDESSEAQTMVHSAVSSTMAERLEELGHISADRLRLSPAPGTATVDDLLDANTHRKPLCELIDQTLVEKAVGYESSIVAIAIARILSNFVSPRRLGLVSGADGMFQLLASTVRAPDVAFVSREQLSDGKFPAEVYPPFAPDLVVEVLSPGNTKAEMSRKRVEYFHSGTRLVWMVDCVNRSVAVYTSPSAVRILNEEATIDGGEVLPGFSSPVADFFADLDLGFE
jgi:Uma2 family endonuclease